MAGTREQILNAIRRNRPQLSRPLPDVPLFDGVTPGSLASRFAEGLRRMGGILLEAPIAGDPLAPVRSRIAGAGVVCSAVPEIPGNRSLAEIAAPYDLADVDYAIVRASFGVAETGSLLLTDRDLQVNAVAYLAQHLIVLLDPDDIVVNLHLAYRRPELQDGNYACFHTGPSATADIEGVLIHGAQGVRSLAVLMVTRPEREFMPDL